VKVIVKSLLPALPTGRQAAGSFENGIITWNLKMSECANEEKKSWAKLTSVKQL